MRRTHPRAGRIHPTSSPPCPVRRRSRQRSGSVGRNWHDDLVRGMSRLAARYPGAECMVSAVFNRSESSLSWQPGSAAPGLAVEQRSCFLWSIREKRSCLQDSPPTRNSAMRHPTNQSVRQCQTRLTTSNGHPKSTDLKPYQTCETRTFQEKRSPAAQIGHSWSVRGHQGYTKDAAEIGVQRGVCFCC